MKNVREDQQCGNSGIGWTPGTADEGIRHIIGHDDRHAAQNTEAVLIFIPVRPFQLHQKQRQKHSEYDATHDSGVYQYGKESVV